MGLLGPKKNPGFFGGQVSAAVKRAIWERSSISVGFEDLTSCPVIRLASDVEESGRSLR